MNGTLLNVCIFKRDCTNRVYRLAHKEDLSAWLFYKRARVSEFINFITRELALRATPHVYHSVTGNNADLSYKCHLYYDNDEIVVALVTTADHPNIQAYNIIKQLYIFFHIRHLSRIPEYPYLSEDLHYDMQELAQFFDPTFSGICDNLEDDFDISSDQNIEEFLREDICELIDKTPYLSDTSKHYYKASNCCFIS